VSTYDHHLRLIGAAVELASQELEARIGLVRPVALASDRGGALYVADAERDRVLVFDYSGRVSSASWAATAAASGGFAGLAGIATGARGTLYTVERPRPAPRRAQRPTARRHARASSGSTPAVAYWVVVDAALGGRTAEVSLSVAVGRRGPAGRGGRALGRAARVLAGRQSARERGRSSRGRGRSPSRTTARCSWPRPEAGRVRPVDAGARGSAVRWDAARASRALIFLAVELLAAALPFAGPRPRAEATLVRDVLGGAGASGGRGPTAAELPRAGLGLVWTRAGAWQRDRDYRLDMPPRDLRLLREWAPGETVWVKVCGLCRAAAARVRAPSLPAAPAGRYARLLRREPLASLSATQRPGTTRDPGSAPAARRSR